VFLHVLLLIVGLVSGCHKKVESAPAELQKSFQHAPPQVKQQVKTASANLQSGDVMQTLRSLAPVTERPDLTTQQRQALAATLNQVNKKIAANPKLETPETYEMRQKMFKAVYGTKRF